MPQHEVTLSYPQGREGRYLWISNHVVGAWIPIAFYFLRPVLIRADSHWVGQCHAGSHVERSSCIFGTKDVRHVIFVPSFTLFITSSDVLGQVPMVLYFQPCSSSYRLLSRLFLLNTFMIMTCTNSSTFRIDMSSTTTRGTPTIQRIFQATMAISSLPVSHSLRCFLVSYLYFRY